MQKKNNAISIYSSSISSKQKQLLLDAYRDYTTFVRSFEQMLQMYSPIYLANYQLKQIASEKDDILPWELEPLTNKRQKAYADFVAMEENQTSDDNYSFISLTKTNPYIEDKYPPIISSPTTHSMHCHVNSLPHSIERCVVIYPKEALLKDMVFIIDGKRSIRYIGKRGDTPISEAFEDSHFCKSMYCMLNILVELHDKERIEQNKEFERANAEGLLRDLMSPYENILLSTLSGLTDETHNIIKEILQKKYPEIYIQKAEDFGLIASSLEFQDLLNVRHIIHHQIETLDGYGRFINGAQGQNKSIRTRYMESYHRLCQGRFNERIERYIKAANGFKPLVETLVPNIFIRDKEESNNKFAQRVKEYAQAHQDQTIYVDTSYPFKEKKKEALIKNLKKLIPNVEIIDNIQTDNIDDFSAKVDNYLFRSRYLEIFQILEHRIGEYCLFEGDKCPPHQGWARIINQRFISPKDVEKWNQYKLLRNDLSHKYYSDELVGKVKAILPTLTDDAILLMEQLDQVKPYVEVGENNIFTVKHADGRVIKLDFETKEILSIEDKKGNKLKTKRQSIPKGKFIEEYPNGTKIGLKGADIESVTLANGCSIDMTKGKLSISEKTTFFIVDDKYYLTTPNSKLILDKNLKLISYISKQKRINIGNNEIIKPTPNHTILIDENGCLKSLEYSDQKRQISLEFKESLNNLMVRFSDDTYWLKANNTDRILHADIELTYKTRKEFVESYKLKKTSTKTKKIPSYDR